MGKGDEGRKESLELTQGRRTGLSLPLSACFLHRHIDMWWDQRGGPTGNSQGGKWVKGAFTEGEIDEQ